MESFRLILQRTVVVRRSAMVRAATLVGGITVGAKLLGLLREAVIARLFGVGAAMDAYAIALGLVSSVTAVLGGALHNSLIPAFLAADRGKGRSSARRLAGHSLSVYLVAAGTTAAVFMIMAPLLAPAIVGGARDPRADLIQRLLVILAGPVIVGGALALFFSGLLNAIGWFGPGATAPATVSIVTLVAIIAFPALRTIEMLAVATAIGFIAYAAVLAWLAGRRRLLIFAGLRGAWTTTRPVVRQFFPAAAGSLAMTFNPSIDLFFAARLGVGNASAYSYGTRICAVAAGILGAAITTPALPHFSSLAASGRLQALKSSVRRQALGILCVAVPLTLAMVLLSRPIVEFLYGGGSFTARDASVVSRIQSVYAFQIPAYSMGMMVAGLLSALGGNRFLFRIGICALVVNVVADALLSRLMGVTGIAAATVVVYVVTCTLAGITAHNLISKRETVTANP